MGNVLGGKMDFWGTGRSWLKSQFDISQLANERQPLRKWVISKTLFASLLALAVAGPMVAILAPQQIWPLMTVALVTTIIVTPIVSYHLLNDLFALLREQNTLLYKANHDGMTGLMNRTYFLDQLDALRQASIASNQPFGVIAIDLDHFKSINDTYGEQCPKVGDAVIRRHVFPA